MAFSYGEDQRFHQAMKGDYTLQNVVDYIRESYYVDDIFSKEEIKDLYISKFRDEED